MTDSQIKEHENKYESMNIYSCMHAPSSISRRAFIFASELSTHTMCVFGSERERELFTLKNIVK